jgi:hypothetical protein
MTNNAREYNSGNNYRTTPTDQVRRMRDKLYLISNNEIYQPETRELARQEVDYMDDMIAFRETQTVRQRAKLVREKIAPWFGNWRRKQ